MRLMLRYRGLSLFIICTIAFIAGALSSSEDFMKKLPNYDKFKCAICHTVPDPATGSAELNPFGTAFHENGDKWDATLATKDSDNDSYSNGREIGDDNGDGTPDISQERSNPGNPLDMPSSIDNETWGIIKNLFHD
ncbi:MAG: hypothetical protein JXB45_05080 [Candidatus Krumholzibacteriota bacterium]|nr:hypothetical protein [Candidatus Krumholzibacteriota bacterium]